MNVRTDNEADSASVHAIHRDAFPTAAEADLVSDLKKNASPLVSLVAEEDARIVGHILFSPVSLPNSPELKLMGLAPMAVVADRRKSGVGSALVREGLRRCRALGIDAVVVLGHADYYPRFGFRPSSQFGLDSEYDVPDEAFMTVELRPGALSNRAGRIVYDPAFRNL